MAEPGQRPRTARLTATIVGALVFGLIIVLALAAPGGQDDATRSALVGQVAPAIVGTDLDGGPYDLDDHRGSWVAVNFFATWCPGCVNEHDDLVAFEQWGQARGDVSLVSVVFQDPPEVVAAFFTERGGGWPVVDRPQVPVDYGVMQIPETFLVAPSGQIVYHIQGEVTAEVLIEAIESLEAGQ